MNDAIKDAISEYNEGKEQKLLKQLEWLIENKILLIEEVTPSIKGDLAEGLRLNGEIRLVVRDKELIDDLTREVQSLRDRLDLAIFELESISKCADGGIGYMADKALDKLRGN